MSFLVRTSIEADTEAVTALLQKSYAVLLRDAYAADVLEAALPLITKARPELMVSGSYYVAEDDEGGIIGAGGWTKHSPTGQDETADNGNIRHFGTDPDHTGKGIGRSLMARCVSDALNAGLAEFNCYSTLNGEAFYRACGFRSVEPFPITLPGGVVFPSVRMTRPL
ncbi:MAG: GNAT family N-acetyltransferase [Pseudomonadota bacterium]